MLEGSLGVQWSHERITTFMTFLVQDRSHLPDVYSGIPGIFILFFDNIIQNSWLQFLHCKTFCLNTCTICKISFSFCIKKKVRKLRSTLQHHSVTLPKTQQTAS